MSGDKLTVTGEPFHVSRSSDGTKHWFSARDAASGVTIPAKDRDDAYALASSLNRACETYAARTNTTTELVEALRRIADCDKRYLSSASCMDLAREALTLHDRALGK